MKPTNNGASGDGLFDRTHWSVVFATQASESAVFNEAWTSLQSLYWKPLYVYARKRGHSHHDAEDLVQGFLEHLLAHNALRNVAPEKGRFRTFLLKCFSNFIAHQRERAGAIKHGGRYVHVSMNQEPRDGAVAIDPADPRTPECLYDLNCALALVQQALCVLEMEYDNDTDKVYFQALRPNLLCNEEKLKTIAQGLNMEAGTFRQKLNRARGRLARIFRDLVAATVSSPDQVQDEIRSLIIALDSKVFNETELNR